MSAEVEEFRARWETVRERIRGACGRCGRDPEIVRVVAVSKNVPPEQVAAAAECGVEVLGESRVQEARRKIPLCPSGLRWHLVGHLQRNKVDEAVRLFELVHSVDSARLLSALDKACGDEGRVLPVCLEVNVSGEPSKFGISRADGPDLLKLADGLWNVRVVGLMTIPPFRPDPEETRSFFRQLRELRDLWRKECGHELAELSMGMSHDFEVAVEEGATWVRLGTSLFGERPRGVARVADVCGGEPGSGLNAQGSGRGGLTGRGQIR